MRCLNDEIVQRYIDSELDEKLHMQVEKHLSVCTQCNSLVQKQKKLSDSFKRIMNSSSSDFIASPVFNKNAGRKTYSVKMMVWEIAAASVLVILIGIGQSKVLHPKSDPLRVTYSGNEVDANKPVTDQARIVTVIDPEGNISEYIE